MEYPDDTPILFVEQPKASSTGLMANVFSFFKEHGIEEFYGTLVDSYHEYDVLGIKESLERVRPGLWETFSERHLDRLIEALSGK